MFIKNLVSMVKKDKGIEGIEKLKKEFGNDVNFSAMTDFPLETEMKLHNAIMMVYFGKVSSENYRKLGEMNMHYYSNSIVGKTIFSLIGKDLKTSALRAQKFIDTIASGIGIKVKELGEKKLSLTLEGLPYPIEYYKGICEESLAYFKKKGKIIATKSGPDEYTYIAEWE
ncbi:hypothetical protein A2476_01985 [candidate division CPR3 bacterium RIFOXYC2_FULL_35_7]|nr:MAG: hypothetical protein A2476_01985 [candidate division CPR3 bacterium RIFOXYC2_FULL_35_7]